MPWSVDSTQKSTFDRRNQKSKPAPEELLVGKKLEGVSTNSKIKLQVVT